MTPNEVQTELENYFKDDDNDERYDRIRALLFHPRDDDNDHHTHSRRRYEYGDRRQEIVFIGIGLRQEAIVKGLNACLLTPEEMEVHDIDHQQRHIMPIGYYPDPFVPRPVVMCAEATTLCMIARPDQPLVLNILPGFCLTLQNLALHIMNDDNDDEENDDDDTTAKGHNDDDADAIRAVQVWLDSSDRGVGSSPLRGGVLLATLRPESHEQQAVSIKLMPLPLPLPTEEDSGNIYDVFFKHGEDEAGDNEDRHNQLSNKNKNNNKIKKISGDYGMGGGGGDDDDNINAIQGHRRGGNRGRSCCEVHFVGTVEPLPYAEMTGEDADDVEGSDDDEE
jgi:hypothetical protein